MTAQFQLRRKEVLRLKATSGDDGQPLTLEVIAKLLGLASAQAAQYYVQGLDGVCPCCYRKLKPKTK